MQICSKCVLSDQDNCTIFFDEKGVCNYCLEHTRQSYTNESNPSFESLIQAIKFSGRKDQYDCIIGLSGGVDSSYVAHIAAKSGLRCLAVHLDNGWNSELAVQNIHQIVNSCKFDLHTHVIDWEEFRRLQVAYIKAGVIDIEALTDHAIGAIIYKLAYQFNVKFILSGSNYSTEGILPEDWHYRKSDAVNIKSIYSKFYSQRLRSFPFLTVKEKAFYELVKGIRSVSILNYLDYNKAEAKHQIIEAFQWRDYGGKHHESLFTKFYQSYILPTKFGVDKRKAHLASLINSGQITRDEAFIELEKPIYPEYELKRDMEFVLKKLELYADEFHQLMKATPVPHTHFKTDLFETKVYYYLVSKLKKLGLK